MPRGITFDYEKAIAGATQLFQSRLPNTSLRPPEGHEIGGGPSPHHQGKGGSTWVLEALQRNGRTQAHRSTHGIQRPPGQSHGVRALLRTVLDQLNDSKTPILCLMAGSISTDVLQERELRPYHVLDEIGAFTPAAHRKIRASKAASRELKANVEPRNRCLPNPFERFSRDSCGQP